jgi:hypothetical protein
MPRVFRRSVVVLLAAVTLAAGAGAGMDESRQRVAITVKPGTVNTFVLRPLTGGPIAPDAGTVAWMGSERSRMRDGRRSRFWSGTGELVGKQGGLRVRLAVDWLDAGNGHEAGWGAWRIVGGTGAYAGLTGEGWSAHIWLPRGPVATRLEGALSAS